MKKINIAYIKNKNIKLSIDFIYFVLNRANSLIKITDKINYEKINQIINNQDTVNGIFCSYFSGNQKLKILFKEFDIQSFFDNIDFFVDITYEDLESLSLEPYDKYNNDKIKGLLKNHCFIFEMNKPNDLIEFFVKIFFDILTQHRLVNGNKRVATMLLYKLFYYYGFFIKNSLGKNSYEYWKSNERIIIGFVEEFQKTRDSNNIQRKIYEWVKENLYIANNFI